MPPVATEGVQAQSKPRKDAPAGATQFDRDRAEVHPFMNPRPHDGPEPVLLIIADISGYTRYMTANAKTLAHSQTIITELIHAIVEQIELPLEVAKLEGDAVFLFCRKQGGALPWPEARRILGERLFLFFGRFRARLAELGRSTTCTCNACTHIEKLRLKVVVHSGEALFHRVLKFEELAGVDVILVHRLLKNSVDADQYLLLTEAAGRDLEFPASVRWIEGAETYDDIGRIRTRVHLPEGGKTDVPAVSVDTFAGRFGKSWNLYRKLWFAPFASKRGVFRNVASDAGGAGKIAFAALTLLLTPIVLPVGAIFAALKAFRSPRQIRHVHDGRAHEADGSCCGPR